MSTRCKISLREPDGTIRCVYCHSDGYLKGVGAILKKNYTTIDKINALLDLGDLSTLGAEPIADVNLWRNFDTIEEYEQLSELFEKHCRTYKSRGDKDVDARIYETKRDFIKNEFDFDIEYVYLFEDGVWKYFDVYNSGKKVLKEV